MALVRYLMQKGYLKDSPKWLSAKGFTAIGDKILSDVMKALKAGEYGTHESQDLGSGSLVLDTTKKYEPGDDIRLLNVPKSLLNTIQRKLKDGGNLNLPLHIDVDDFEEYETMQDVQGRSSVLYRPQLHHALFINVWRHEQNRGRKACSLESIFVKSQVLSLRLGIYCRVWRTCVQSGAARHSLSKDLRTRL